MRQSGRRFQRQQKPLRDIDKADEWIDWPKRRTGQDGSSKAPKAPKALLGGANKSLASSPRPLPFFSCFLFFSSTPRFTFRFAGLPSPSFTSFILSPPFSFHLHLSHSLTVSISISKKINPFALSPIFVPYNRSIPLRIFSFLQALIFKRPTPTPTPTPTTRPQEERTNALSASGPRLHRPSSSPLLYSPSASASWKQSASCALPWLSSLTFPTRLLAHQHCLPGPACPIPLN